MLMLSEIKHYRNADETGRRARIADLSVALLEDDYPPVKQIFFQTDERRLAALDQNQVQTVDWRFWLFKTANLKAANHASTKDLACKVLLFQDILRARA